MEAKYYTSNKTNYKELSDIGQFLRAQSKKIVCVSGGFDPFHIGHLEMILGASVYGSLIVLVNGDEFLKRKKGYVFMPELERVKIIQSIKGVEQAFIYKSDNQFITNGLVALKPDYFINGGDRNNIENMAQEEKVICDNLGIKLEFFGNKLNSSSKLCENFYHEYNRLSNFKDMM